MQSVIIISTVMWEVTKQITWWFVHTLKNCTVYYYALNLWVGNLVWKLLYALQLCSITNDIPVHGLTWEKRHYGLKSKVWVNLNTFANFKGTYTLQLILLLWSFGSTKTKHSETLFARKTIKHSITKCV